MKKLFYFHLKNITLIICSIDALLLFLFLHFYSGNFYDPHKGIINGIADGVILAILLSLINLLINNFHHLNEMKRLKESVNNMLVISLLKYVYGDKKLPDLSQVSIKETCEKILESIDIYKEKEFTEFQYAIRNDYDAIIQNINVVAHIDSMHSFAYGILISNLNALLKQWKGSEENSRKYNLDHPIDDKKKYYNLYLKSKYHIKIYIETCIKFYECEFEDFSANLADNT